MISIPVLLGQKSILMEIDHDCTPELLLRLLITYYRSEIPASPALWEAVPELERPLHHGERIGLITERWPRSSIGCCLSVKSEEQYNSMQRIVFFALRNPPALAEFSRRPMFYGIPKPRRLSPEWKHGSVAIGRGMLSMVQQSTAGSATYTMQFDVKTCDIYYALQSGPGKYTLAVRSQLPSSHFADPADAALWLSTDKLEDFHCLIVSLNLNRAKA